jgi:hypothetical protein
MTVDESPSPARHRQKQLSRRKVTALYTFCRRFGQQLGKGSYGLGLSAGLMRAAPDRLRCHVVGIAHLRFNNEELSDTQLLGPFPAIRRTCLTDARSGQKLRECFKTCAG